MCSITELFLNQEETSEETINKIMDVTAYFCSTWKSHRKTSPPNRPNFNRDILQQKIVSIIESHDNFTLKTALT